MAGIFGKKPIVAKAAKKPVAAKKSGSKATPEERFRMIEQAAYFRAERVGFSGDPAEHWAAAEKDVDKILARKK